jgi:Aldo/keto reductase family
MDHGIARFDVAPSYGMGTAETVLGMAIRKRSAKISTKFGIEPPRLGRFLAWGRAPYRHLRSVIGKGRPSPLPNRLASCGFSNVKLMKSLERSLRALSIDQVHTLLSHEHIDGAHLTEYLDDLELARSREMFNLFGCSGEREAVEQTLRMFCDFSQVIQVSISDSEAFHVYPIVRLFGAVRVLAPQIERKASLDQKYRDGLLSALPGINSFQECFALGAIAAARTLFPRSTLLVNTSNEDRIRDIARFLFDRPLVDWGAGHRVVHSRMLADRAPS